MILSYYDRTGIPILRIVIVSSLKRYFLDFVTEKRKYKDKYNCPKIDVQALNPLGVISTFLVRGQSCLEFSGHA